MASKITLFDLAKKEPVQGWSNNVWKTRLALNYKNLDYETKFLDFHEIEPTLKPLGIEPNTQGSAYTVPTIAAPDGTHVMDSVKIAKYLESHYGPPNYPALKFDEARIAEVAACMQKFSGALIPIAGPKFMSHILTQAGVDYLASKFQALLAQVEKTPEEEFWKAAEPSIEGLAALLKEKDGPFVEGNERSYADLPVVAYFHALSLVPGHEAFTRLMSADPSFQTLYDEYLPYLKRSD